MKALLFLFCTSIFSAVISTGVYIYHVENALPSYEVNTTNADYSKKFHELEKQIAELSQLVSTLNDSTLNSRNTMTEKITANESEAHRELSNTQIFIEEEKLQLQADDKLAELNSETSTQAFHREAEAAYEQDQRNDTWASTQEDTIEAILADQEHFHGIDLYYLDCRSASCRVELFVSEDTPKHAEPMLAGLLGSELPHASWQREGNLLTLQFSKDAISQTNL